MSGRGKSSGKRTGSSAGGGKGKRTALEIRSGLSHKAYLNLVKNARNARRRITNFSKSKEAENYIIPDVNAYTTEALVNRLYNGEHINTITAELKKLTAAKIKSGTPLDEVITKDKYKLSKKERNDLIKALTEANKNIKAARRKYKDFPDILPQPFDKTIFLDGLVNKDTVNNRIEDLKVFTPENLEPTAINDAGEAGTIAEYKYRRAILERENKRREEVRKLRDPAEQQGYFPQQRDIDERPIDIDSIPDMASLRRKSDVWDDPQRVYRSNLFLTNYLKSLADYKATLEHSIGWNSALQMRYDEIVRVIKDMFYDEKRITYAAYRMPYISIAIISGEVMEDGISMESFEHIYNNWMDLEDLGGDYYDDYEG